MKLLKGNGYCPECAKQVYTEAQVKEEAGRLAYIARARRHYRDNSGIPPKFISEDFSTFQKGWQDKAFNACWEYAEGFPIDKRPVGYKSLYLWSSSSWGTGKTHLACSILHRVLDRWSGEERGCSRVLFLSEPDLFRRIQATYSFSREESQMRESEDDIIQSILYADLVVLDDVGKEERINKQFIQRTIFSLIDGRYKNNLPLVLTANLSPSGLKEHLESASFDRIYEMIERKHIRMDGKSYRRRE